MRKAHAIVFSSISRGRHLTANAQLAHRTAMLRREGRREARRQRILTFCLAVLLLLASCAKRLESFKQREQAQERAAAGKEVRRG